MRWPWQKRQPATPPQWFVHYQGFGEPEYVSYPMSEQDAQAELDSLRQFQLTFPPQERPFPTKDGPVMIKSFTGCRAWIDTK